MFERPRFARRAERVLALLEEERLLLRSGRIAALGPLAARRERLVAALGPVEPGPETEALLGRIRAAAARNLRLIGECRAGLAQARAAIARGGNADLGLYSAQGTRLAPAAPERRSDRKA